MSNPNPDTTVAVLGASVHEFNRRCARSTGYDAGYRGAARETKLTVAMELVEWYAGYDLAAATVKGLNHGGLQCNDLSQQDSGQISDSVVDHYGNADVPESAGSVLGADLQSSMAGPVHDRGDTDNRGDQDPDSRHRADGEEDHPRRGGTEAKTEDSQIQNESVNHAVPSDRRNGDELPVGNDGAEHGTDATCDAIGPTAARRCGTDADPVAARNEATARLDVPTLASRAGLHSCGIVVIVDLMNMLVRAYFAGEVSAINGVRSMFETLGSVIDKLSPEYIVFAMEGGYVERTKLYPPYKQGRPPKPPELVEQIALAEKAIEAIGWPSIRVIGWEADDVIASLATQFADVSVGTVICSSDKDLLQLAGISRVYHPWKGGEFITAAKCQEKHGVLPGKMIDYVSLAGEKDEAPGVEGIGAKTAAKLVNEYVTLDEVLAAAERGDIPGAVGKKLKAQSDIARMSRELVTLRTDLPVGIHWQKWPLHDPRAGWRQELEALGLGTPAARLATRLTDGIKRGTTCADMSHMEIEWAVMADCPAVKVVPVEMPVSVATKTAVDAPPKRKEALLF